MDRSFAVRNDNGCSAPSSWRPYSYASSPRSRASAYSPQDTSAVARLLAAIGQSLLAQGRSAEAVEKLLAATGRIPNDLTVQTELGLALWHQGQHRAAVAVLTGVLTIDGHASDALRARGEILADLGEAEKALRDLDRVRRRRRPSAQAARALALATLRRLSAADTEIDAALIDAPDNGPVLLYAARVGALGGDRIMAANLARRAEAAENPALPPHQLEAPPDGASASAPAASDRDAIARGYRQD
jgi:tetratricopeptide (TPR) repeat protein